MSEDTVTSPSDLTRESLPPGTPSRVGRYEVLRVLGEGMFGRVYLCHDPEIDRYVAVKVPILPPESRSAFLKEARLVAGIHHEHICPVYDVGTQGELPFIVMRYVPGGTLADVIAREPPTVNQALDWACQIARGLEAAHAVGVIHRDLKPANILYDAAENTLLLTDFGIAKSLAGATATTGGVKGTPIYMAPEQWGPGGPFGDVSARTDVYALGVILYRMLTGQTPFTGNQYELMFHHCNTAPKKPSEVLASLDRRLDDTVLKALCKNSAERYESANALATAVRGYSKSLPAEATRWRIDVPGEWFSKPTATPEAERGTARFGLALWRWFSKPTATPGAEWVKAADLPAEVRIDPNNIYKLSIAKNATDDDLTGLISLRNLTELDTLMLFCPEVTDSGLAHLRSLTQLRTLHLWAGRVSGTGLIHLNALSELNMLTLGCSSITDASLSQLPALNQLQTLGLLCTPITGSGLAQLRRLTQLRRLHLMQCDQITDVGLAHLHGLTQLQELNFFNCERLTDAGIAELQRALPNCEIKR